MFDYMRILILRSRPKDGVSKDGTAHGRFFSSLLKKWYRSWGRVTGGWTGWPNRARPASCVRSIGGRRCQALALAGNAALTDPVCGKSPEHQWMVDLAAAEAPDFRYRRTGAED